MSEDTISIYEKFDRIVAMPFSQLNMNGVFATLDQILSEKTPFEFMTLLVTQHNKGLKIFNAYTKQRAVAHFIHSYDTDGDNNLLGIAIETNSPYWVQYLFQKNINIHWMDPKGRTAIMRLFDLRDTAHCLNTFKDGTDLSDRITTQEKIFDYFLEHPEITQALQHKSWNNTTAENYIKNNVEHLQEKLKHEPNTELMCQKFTSKLEKTILQSHVESSNKTTKKKSIM